MSCGRKEIVATMTLAFDLSIWMESCGYLLRWGPKGQGQGQVHVARGTVIPEPCLVQVKFQLPFRRPSGDIA